MLGIIAAVIAGAKIRRIWPTGLLFLIGITVASLLIDLAFVRPGQQESRKLVRLSPLPDMTPELLALTFLTTFLLCAVPFFVAWGIAKLVRSRRSAADNGQNDGPAG